MFSIDPLLIAGRPSLSICFITIFSWQLWLCILGVFFTFVLLAYLLNRLVSPQEEADSFGRTLWLSAGSFLCRSPGPEGRFVKKNTAFFGVHRIH